MTNARKQAIVTFLRANEGFLDEAVHDAKSEEACNVNNQGSSGQIDYLGWVDVSDLVGDLAPEYDPDGGMTDEEIKARFDELEDLGLVRLVEEAETEQYDDSFVDDWDPPSADELAAFYLANKDGFYDRWSKWRTWVLEEDDDGNEIGPSARNLESAWRESEYHKIRLEAEREGLYYYRSEARAQETDPWETAWSCGQIIGSLKASGYDMDAKWEAIDLCESLMGLLAGELEQRATQAGVKG